ncbi:MAG: hypothetical protein VR67_19395 [Peptococcaceae bacterium BRH_c8a]|nr:MAG: hypothetical protein VR67_19395 [Peptococcaceae bacterium BRH_c8a]
MSDSKVAVKDARKVFRKQGACSSAFMFILNREFGSPMDKELRAAEPLAGGILRQGYQCGMLWGSALAVGAESYHRSDDLGQAVATAITATNKKEFMSALRLRTVLSCQHNFIHPRCKLF